MLKIFWIEYWIEWFFCIIQCSIEFSISIAQGYLELKDLTGPSGNIENLAENFVSTKYEMYRLKCAAEARQEGLRNLARPKRGLWPAACLTPMARLTHNICRNIWKVFLVHKNNICNNESKCELRFVNIQCVFSKHCFETL